MKKEHRNFEGRKPSVIKARNLRKSMTVQESRLWDYLRDRRFHGIKFRRQQQIDYYIADFCCLEKKFISPISGEGSDNNGNNEG